jgi:hypothetical protein
VSRRIGHGERRSTRRELRLLVLSPCSAVSSVVLSSDSLI